MFVQTMGASITSAGSGICESDPNGKSQHEAGAKMDSGKVRMDLLVDGFPRALKAIAEVATYGANKYTDNGWIDVPEGDKRYKAAMYRHFNSAAMGEIMDSESGLLHLAHGAWGALAVLELYLRSLNGGDNV